jgi:hypothetical protein
MAESNIDELDIEDHDGATKGLKLGGVLVTATAAEINKQLDAESWVTALN